LTDSIITLLTV